MEQSPAWLDDVIEEFRPWALAIRKLPQGEALTFTDSAGIFHRFTRVGKGGFSESFVPDTTEYKGYKGLLITKTVFAETE